MQVLDRRLNPGGKNLENRQRFLRRAKAIVQQAVRQSSQSRDISDILEGGEVSIRREGDAVVFALRSVPSTLRLVSRAAAPQELGLARDPRVLGVAVRAIEARQDRHLRTLGAADPLLADGFHGYEPAEDLRWTDGDAPLPTALFDRLTGPIELTLRLAGGTAYIEEGTAVRAA